MASVHVYIELAGNRPAEASLQALGEGRRLASVVGATLYAVLPCAEVPRYDDDDVIAVLGRHGADKVVMLALPQLAGPALYRSHGYALYEVCKKLPPMLLLLAATPGGRDVAPRLAAQLGAAFVAEPSIETGPQGQLVLSRTVYGGRFRRRLIVEDLERPVVATLTPGSYLTAQGAGEAEVVVLEVDGPLPEPFAESSHAEDPGAALDTADIVIAAGAGVDAAAYARLEELARRLGAELAVTGEAALRGLGTFDRTVGVSGRRVAPRLYIACGASGSPSHLMAVSPDAEIVAINQDPDAPIFRVATYGMVGDVGAIVDELLGSLGQGPTAEGAAS